MSRENALPVLELLADRAVGELAAEDAPKLEAMLAEQPSLDDDSMDLAAAAVDLAMMDALDDEEPLPAHLRQSLKVRAEAFNADKANVAAFSDWQKKEPEPQPKPTASTTAVSWLGWLAAAILLAIGLAGWWPELAPTSAPELTLAEQRANLLATAPDAVELSWSATEDPTSTDGGGTVVWSDALQKGYMTFSGLKANNPNEEQYQLWIFGKGRDDRFPVDGGVFDVPAGATEVIVPIDAKLFVKKPQLFAITVEKPGGVVVSSRERITLLAKPS